MEIVIPIIAAVVGVAAGAGGIFAYNKKNEKGGKDKADDLVRKAKREAQDIVLSAKKEASAITEKAVITAGRSWAADSVPTEVRQPTSRNSFFIEVRRISDSMKPVRIKTVLAGTIIPLPTAPILM